MFLQRSALFVSRDDIEAIYCIHCGAALDGSPGDAEHRTKTTDMQALTPEMIREWIAKNTKEAAIPDTGIAFYFDVHSMPAYVDLKDEFILGRKVGTTAELLLDLAPFAGYSTYCIAPTCQTFHEWRYAMLQPFG